MTYSKSGPSRLRLKPTWLDLLGELALIGLFLSLSEISFDNLHSLKHGSSADERTVKKDTSVRRELCCRHTATGVRSVSAESSTCWRLCLCGQVIRALNCKPSGQRFQSCS